MTRIAENFSAHAQSYDEFAKIQPLVAARLAATLTGKPRRILEIGCGTGHLSAHLLQNFPDAELVLSDISSSMLALCQQKLGSKPTYLCFDAASLPQGLGRFDLIVSSLALQWIDDLGLCLQHLSEHLQPHGRLAVSILGNKNFSEWASLLREFGGVPGLHHYPSIENFPWPEGKKGEVSQEFLQEHYKSGTAFLKALKKIGASAARRDHKPTSVAQMRQVLKATEQGFAVTYHVLYANLMP